MSYSKVDPERQQMQPAVTEIPLGSPTPANRPSQLQIYQRLIGDIDKPAPTGRGSKHGVSFYHQVVSRERKARTWFWVTGLTFAALVTAQIVFCLSIV